jgi:hypothetical protein
VKAETSPINHLSSTARFFIKPVNIVNQDTHLQKFEDALIVASRDCSVSDILKLSSPDIILSFGDRSEQGLTSLQSLLSSKIGVDVCKALLDILRLGGDFTNENKDEFVVPYVSVHFPQELSDQACDYGVITRKNVNLRKYKSIRSPVLTQLSFEVVYLQEGMDPYEEWIPVLTHDNIGGYISRQYLRSPCDYRAVFKKRGDVWFMVAFVAGD